MCAATSFSVPKTSCSLSLEFLSWRIATNQQRTFLLRNKSILSYVLYLAVQQPEGLLTMYQCCYAISVLMAGVRDAGKLKITRRTDSVGLWYIRRQESTFLTASRSLLWRIVLLQYFEQKCSKFGQLCDQQHNASKGGLSWFATITPFWAGVFHS